MTWNLPRPRSRDSARHGFNSRIPILKQLALAVAFALAFQLVDVATAGAQKSAAAPAFYLPLGLAIALVLWGGPLYWPLVLLCELIGAVVSYHRPLFSWCGIPGVIGVYIFYAAGLYVVRRWWKLDASLSTVADVGRMSVTFLICAIPTAIIGGLTFLGDGLIDRSAFASTIINWWESDAIAILTFAPVLLLFVAPWLTSWMWHGVRLRTLLHAIRVRPLRLRENTEVIAQALSVAASLWLVFRCAAAIPYQPLYTLFIPVIWISIRHGLRGASLATFAINCGAMFIADAQHSAPDGLPRLQLAMLMLALTGLCVGAVVTERKRVERALERSEFSLSRAQSVAKVGSWNMDIRSGEIVCSEETYRIFELTVGTPLSLGGLKEMFHPEDRASFDNSWQAALACGKYDVEYRIQRHGATKWLRARAEIERSPSGQPLFAIGTVQDITERKQAEEALRQAEEKYRGMFEDAAVGMYECDPAGRLLTANRALAKMFGYSSPQDMLAQTREMPGKFSGEQDLRAEFTRLLAESGMVRDFEYQVRRADGVEMWLLENARAVRGRDGNTLFIEGAVHDISQRKTLEAQLRQAQKMEAVGRLAGGVAHDFNNALGVMMGYCELIQLGFPPDDPIQSRLDEILKAAHRAASLTRQLLAFSRKQSIQPVILDLNLIVTETEKMLRRLIGENIELSVIRAPGLKAVRADKGQVEQILMNLLVNARDAMPRGGRIVIETRNVEFTERSSRHVFLKPGRYVMLRVTDNGSGMSKEVLAHIFEPFFTTKDAEKGTGLGLSTVYGIVKQSDGYLLVDSEVGVGTTFRVYLPLVEGTPEPAATAVAAPRTPSGTETILLVEDEDSLRTLAQGCLRGRGYSILAAHDGEEALQIAQQHQGPIHLLLTDVIMPGISGRELADSLKTSRADLKVLYISGYTHDLVTQQGILGTGCELLQKPFSINTLLVRVREILDSPAPRSETVHAVLSD
ncbi:MAG TPA: PAS domain S-box protein [Terriglobales bacterium]|nr:PAS domain S-box protein [Terriglobales bacterium]